MCKLSLDIWQLFSRAESHGSGFAIIRDAENGEKCTVTYTTHVDLKGELVDMQLANEII